MNWPSCSATNCRAACGRGSGLAMLQVPEVAEGIRPIGLAVRGGQVHGGYQAGAVPRVADGDQSPNGDTVQNHHVPTAAVPQKANLDWPVGVELAQQHLPVHPPLLADAVEVQVAVNLTDPFVRARLVAGVA